MEIRYIVPMKFDVSDSIVEFLFPTFTGFRFTAKDDFLKDYSAKCRLTKWRFKNDR